MSAAEMPASGAACAGEGGAEAAAAAGAAAHAELTAKQVRELRRLCRKTANRAEYDDRSVQVRQIASILAMGSPSLRLFAPGYWATGSALQAWVDRVRADGADWRDERILLPRAVEELRDWDRLLKIWARRRFAAPPEPEEDDDDDVDTPSRRPPAKQTHAQPRTPLAEIRNHTHTGNTAAKWLNASPLSISAEEVTPKNPAVRRTRSGLPLRDAAKAERRSLGTPITPATGSDALSQRSPPDFTTPRPRLVPAPSVTANSRVIPFADDLSDSDGADAGVDADSPIASSEYDGMPATLRRPHDASVKSLRAPLSTLSISRDGNVINIDIPVRPQPKTGRSPTSAVRDENVAPGDFATLRASRASKTFTSGVGVREERPYADKVRDWGALRGSTRARTRDPVTMRRDKPSRQFTGMARVTDNNANVN